MKRQKIGPITQVSGPRADRRIVTSECEFLGLGVNEEPHLERSKNMLRTRMEGMFQLLRLSATESVYKH